jgi:hypothetical protein
MLLMFHLSDDGTMCSSEDESGILLLMQQSSYSESEFPDHS